MAGLNIPDDPIQLENRSLADLQRELPETANPFLQESWMGAQAIANSRRTFEFYKQLRILELEAIPITAVEKLELWASVWGITRNPATQSNGGVVATGAAGSLIPIATELNSSDGNLYTTAAEVFITEKILLVAELTSVGTVATVKLPNPESLFDGLEVVMAGADQPEYNGTFEMRPTDLDEFQYDLPASAVTPATGTITATIVTGVMQVQSVGFGQSQNQDPNARLSFSTGIGGVDSAAFVDQGAVGGGSDIETDEELRTRMLERIQNPVALFNPAAISNKAKEVPGVTDVFIYEITPAPGQVTIFFVRGNDANPIPDASEVDTVKNKILEIKPAHTADFDVIVLAPTPANATFSFDTLTPNNQTIRDAIVASLDALFRDEGAVGEPITFEQYNAAIVNAGAQAYDLSSPAGDIGGGFDEYPVLVAVNFP